MVLTVATYSPSSKPVVGVVKLTVVAVLPANVTFVVFVAVVVFFSRVSVYVIDSAPADVPTFLMSAATTIESGSVTVLVEVFSSIVTVNVAGASTVTFSVTVVSALAIEMLSVGASPG